MDNIPAGYDENGVRCGFGDMEQEPKGESDTRTIEDVLTDLELEDLVVGDLFRELEYEIVSR